MATPHFRLDSISRGSRRTDKNGRVRIRPAQLGGSLARRVEYVERGGSLANRADEVLHLCSAGPPCTDWQALDRAEIRRDAQVGRELVATVPYPLSLAAKCRIGQTMADLIAREFDVPVRGGLHNASHDGDQRNDHYHFVFPARDSQGKKLTRLSNRRAASKVVAWLRGAYQDMVNGELERVGIADWLDLRSRASRGMSEPCQRVEKREFVRARRGEIYSPKYVKNQAILAARRAEAAYADATANVARTSRNLVRTKRRSRTDRAIARSQRSLGVAAFCRAQCGQHSSPSRGRGGSADHVKRTEYRSHEPVSGTATQRVDTHTDRPLRRPGRPAPADGLARRTGSSVRADAIRTNVGSGPATAPKSVEVRPPVEPSRSLFERVLRLFCGADKREAVARKGAVALAQAQAEAKRQADETITRANAERERAAGAVREAQAACVREAADSTKPLICVQTPTGSKFHIRREDWLEAKRNKTRDVPLCDQLGAPIKAQPGERIKTTIRLSTVEASKLTPTQIIAVTDYQFPSQEQDSPGITM